jgi:hypothetical protein
MKLAKKAAEEIQISSVVIRTIITAGVPEVSEIPKILKDASIVAPDYDLVAAAIEIVPAFHFGVVEALFETCVRVYGFLGGHGCFKKIERSIPPDECPGHFEGYKPFLRAEFRRYCLALQDAVNWAKLNRSPLPLDSIFLSSVAKHSFTSAEWDSVSYLLLSQ